MNESPKDQCTSIVFCFLFTHYHICVRGGKIAVRVAGWRTHYNKLWKFRTTKFKIFRSFIQQFLSLFVKLF